MAYNEWAGPAPTFCGLHRMKEALWGCRRENKNSGLIIVLPALGLVLGPKDTGLKGVPRRKPLISGGREWAEEYLIETVTFEPEEDCTKGQKAEDVKALEAGACLVQGVPEGE